MKLIYISAARIPSEKAHPYQILQMCDALAGQGIQIELLHPRRVNTPAMRKIRDIREYYGLRHAFPITSLATVDLLDLTNRLLGWQPRLLSGAQNRFSFPLLMATYLRSLLKYLGGHEADVYYVRDWQILSALARARPDLIPGIVYEAHTFPAAGADQQERRPLLSQIKIVVITQNLKTLHASAGVPPENILVAPDGVDPQRFSNLAEKREARRQLGLPQDRTIICYTGHLYPWKGVQVLARSARYLPVDYQIYIVGGMPEDVAALRQMVRRENLPQVEIVGHIPPIQVPLYLAAADILALPNSSQYEISQYHTSPLKLFEYMASGRPIVASDLPSIREVLNEQNGVLVRADDPQALAEGIRWAKEHPDSAQTRAQQAQVDVEKYTWPKRAQKILAFLENSMQSPSRGESR